ncbi:MAG: hypothetical protein FJ135_11300 [Deltaproteobacteria bacterium]|nr:hypothetical protein [Deltaproteobacteria bacterium]
MRSRKIKIILLISLLALCLGAKEGGIAPYASWNNLPNKPEITVGDDGYATFAEAVATLNARGAEVTLVLPPGPHKVGKDLTVKSNITLAPKRGAIITRDGGLHLTIQGPFECGLWQCFADNSPSRQWVVFAVGVVKEVIPEWWGAAGDDNKDNTAALQAAINAAECCYGVLRVLPGTYRHGGLSFSKGLSIVGSGWKSILKNTSTTKSSISRTGGADEDTQGILIRDLALEHTAPPGHPVDGIFIQNVFNHLRIDRVKVYRAPRDGISIEGAIISKQGSHYAVLTQIYVAGPGRHGLHINGGVNSGLAMGGRIDGGSGYYNINVEDTISGTPKKYPNTWTFMNLDVPGAAPAAGIRDNGSSNKYIGMRFEKNTVDILLDQHSRGAMFWGARRSSNGVIKNNAAVAPMFIDRFNKIRTFQNHGFFEYYDEADGGLRILPKRGVITARIPAIAAGSSATLAIARIPDPITITRVSIVPDAAITGNNTNYFRLGVRANNGKGGIGELITSLTFNLGTDVPAYKDAELSVSSTKLSRSANDVLMFEKLDYAGGMNMPNLTVQVEYTGR